MWSTDLYKFMELDGFNPEAELDQARIVAAFRVEKQMESVLAYQNRPKKKASQPPS